MLPSPTKDEQKKRLLAKFICFWCTAWGLLLICFGAVELVSRPDLRGSAVMTIAFGSGVIYLGQCARRRGQGTIPVAQSEPGNQSNVD